MALGPCALLFVGCGLPSAGSWDGRSYLGATSWSSPLRGSVDIEAAQEARLAVQARAASTDVLVARSEGSRDDWDRPFFDDELDRERPVPAEPERGSVGDVIVAELLAIFPGIILTGTGHWYAGDSETAGKLLRVGGVGYALTAVGAGLVYGGYELDRKDDTSLEGYAYTLYGTGGVVGGVGVLFVLTAWGFDLIDTPRAVLSGGKPPPPSEFVESLDLLGG